MGTISVSLPADGTVADVSDYNTPINTIVNAINGGLDNDNIAAAAAISGSKLANAAVTASKMVNGQIYRRQGGSATEWTTQGTTNYDVSSTDVKIQAGSINVDANPKTVTFPVAFTYKPLIFLTVSSATSSNVFVRYKISGSSNTQIADIVTLDAAGSVVTTESVNWLAIGV